MDRNERLIVGIGASAGGVTAVKQFFEHVPADSDLAYVVVLHLSPRHESHLAEVLQVSSAIPVTQVQEPVAVASNHVYVIPPGRSMRLEGDSLTLSEVTRLEERRAPVDIFFRTLAESQGNKAVSVILSGTGADGSMGIKRVKEQGGICIVQDPDEAEFGDMPRSSIATGLVDHVLPVAEIPQKVLSYRNSRAKVVLDQVPLEPESAEEHAVRDILKQLRTASGHDFVNYKRGTVLRRIARRMSLHALDTLPAYALFVREHPEELQGLLKDLLISVTNFFRDPEAFEALARIVIPRLFAAKGNGDQVRAWVAGCATGEEAYSIAMMLSEYAATLPGPGPTLQIFATDIDTAAIATGRQGLYTLKDAADVSPERLRRFFLKEGDAYRVRPEVREIVLFADHNVVRDPPFSHLDLVSCRNLLIYLNRSAQQRVLEVFHFGLKTGGYLFLGGSETVEGSDDLFAAVDKDAHIFESRAAAVRVSVPELSTPGAGRPRGRPLALSFEQAEMRLSAAELHQRLLEAYAPPSIVVNEDHEIVHASERAGQYLQFPGGEPSHNLLRVIRPELRIELRTALYQAAQQRTNIDTGGMVVHLDERTVTVKMSVRPVFLEHDPARGLLLVLFENVTDADEETPTVTVAAGDAARHFEEELLRVKARLGATVERHETQAEELKASNEELQAMNEELRSSAEELETSREELQSLNEELRTVNQELRIKVDEESQAKNDIQNLISSTEIGIVFLDRASRVKLFTPRARDIFTLIPADRGRPLSDINTALVESGLHGDIERVLDTLQRVEREVQTRDGCWYLMRMFPYRTADDRIGGVVMAFVDITRRRQTEEALRASEERLRRAIGIDTVGVLFFRIDGAITEANDAFLRMSGYQREDLAGAIRWDAMTPPEHAAQMRRDIDELKRLGRTVPYEKEYLRKDGTRWSGMAAATVLAPGEGVEFVLDVSATRRAEERLHQSEGRLRLMVDSVTDYAIFTMDVTGHIDGWNAGAARMFGFDEGEVIGRSVEMLFVPEDRAAGVHLAEQKRAQQEGRASDERWHTRKDGSRFFASGVVEPLRDKDANTVGFVKIARDLTERKQWEDRLKTAHAEAEAQVIARTSELAAANVALGAQLHERKGAETQIRSLLRRLITVQEDERRRIARDLHDHLGQLVAGLSLKIDGLHQRLKEHADLQLSIDDAQETIARVGRDLDFFTWELRPAALDDLGLEEAIRQFVSEWSANFGVRAEFHSGGIAGVRLPYEVETNFYRIMQEALNNVYKHARAARVGVILERREGDVVLIIEDDGIGFNLSAKTKIDSEHGLGLLGMRERASLIGATLEIETAPRKGTTVFVRVPAAEAAPEENAGLSVG